jgi:predicted DNA-binding protein (MmcQ/YjbR family)
MARAQWVALQNWDAVTVTELKRLIRGSYDMVLAKLPKKKQAELRG